MYRLGALAAISLVIASLAALLMGCGGGSREGVTTSPRSDGKVAVAAQTVALLDNNGKPSARAVSLPEIVVAPGRTAELPVTLAGAAEVAGVTVALEVDPAVFACDDIRPGSWTPPKAQVVVNAAKAVMAVAGTDVADETTAPVPAPVTLATFRLRALPTAAPQNAVVKLTASVYDTRGNVLGRTASTAAAQSSKTVRPKQSGSLIGDLVGTGAPDVGSAIKILRVVVGLDAPPADADKWRWDCNGSGAIDVVDAIKILRCVVRLDAWPIGVVATGDFTVQADALLYRNTPVFLKGIGYSPFHPGETPVYGPMFGKFSLPDDSRYQSDLTTISGIHANFVHVFPQFMPPSFFSALRQKGLFYAQDVYVNGFASDLLAADFQTSTLAFIKQVIDHTYAYGAAERLVFFSVGDEINAGTIYRTDTAHPGVNAFSGRFIHVSGRTPSEVAIAQLIDGAMSYEADTYGTRHLYTHTSWTHIGPVDRPDLEVAKSSIFFADFADLICMNIYTYARGVITSSPGSTTGTRYQGYIEDLERLSAKPIIITQVGLSTSPIAPDPGIPGFGGNTPEQVASTYAQVWQDVRTSSVASRIAGLSWFEYCDEWWKTGQQANDQYSQDASDPEEWFGIFSISESGTLSAKGGIANAVTAVFGGP